VTSANLPLSILVVVPFTAGWLVLLYYLDPRWREKKIGHAPVLLMAAGGLSLLCVRPLYAINPFLGSSPLGPFAYHFFVVGFSEEFAKFVVFILMTRILKSLREPADGIIQGAAVGIGFSIVEDVIYGATYGPGVVLYRAIGLGVHALAGAIWGFAWAGAVYENTEASNRGAFFAAIGMFALATLFHSLYNTICATVYDYSRAEALIIVLQLVALAASGAALVWMRRRSPYHAFPYSEAEQAVEYIQRGLAHNPGSLTLTRRLGVYLIAAGRYRDAVARLSTVADRRPDNPILQVMLGVAAIGATTEVPLGAPAADKSEPINGEELIHSGAGRLTDIQYRKLNRELGRIIPDACLQERVEALLRLPERQIELDRRRVDSLAGRPRQTGRRCR
jgi:RsiW-degrading membrane proteinase PrsW (M82 family)